MSTLAILTVLLVAIGTGVSAVLITVAVSSLVEAHRVRLEPRLAGARLAIIVALSGEDLKAEEALAHLSPLSERYVVDILLDLAPSVLGSSKSVLVSLGEQMGVLDRAWAGLHARRWSVRLYSARVLTAFAVGTEDFLPLFDDRSPEVRAQAAAWCVAVPGHRGTDRLIELLQDSDGQCRFAAKDALIRIGHEATDQLVGAVDGADVVLVRQILEVAAAIGDQRFFEMASDYVTDPEPRTRSLALSVLASTGNPNSGELLIASLGDRSEGEVVSATRGLAKLGYWPGAISVEPLLSHSSWAIRKQAALTLLALGAPGTILLRADAPGVGPAAEMALQALELQSLALQDEVA